RLLVLPFEKIAVFNFRNLAIPTPRRSVHWSSESTVSGAGDDHGGPRLLATMSLLAGLMLVEIRGLVLQGGGDGRVHLLVQSRLILLDGQEIVSLPLTDRRGDLLLTAHRIDGH